MLPSGQLLYVSNRQILLVNPADGTLASSLSLRPGDSTPAISPSLDGSVVFVSDGSSVSALPLNASTR